MPLRKSSDQRAYALQDQVPFADTGNERTGRAVPEISDAFGKHAFVSAGLDECQTCLSVAL